LQWVLIDSEYWLLVMVVPYPEELLKSYGKAGECCMPTLPTRSTTLCEALPSIRSDAVSLSKAGSIPSIQWGSSLPTQHDPTVVPVPLT
jgi:hypothetical protein